MDSKLSQLTFFSISNEGLGSCSCNEVKELVEIDSLVQKKDSIYFDLSDKDFSKIIYMFKHNQSLLSLSCFLSSFKFDLEKEEITNFDIKKLLCPLFDGTKDKILSYKVEITSLKGNENRINLCRKLYPLIEDSFKDQLEVELKLDFKDPQLIFQVYFTGKEFMIGLKLNKSNFDSRDYRLYAHQASFKGDFAYSLLRKLSLKKNDSVLVLFCKDSVLSIETEFFKQNKILRSPSFEDYLSHIPFFSKLVDDCNDIQTNPVDQPNLTISFDENFANIRASRNNAKIAGVLDQLEIIKSPLGEFQDSTSGKSFDKIYLHLTRKDEGRLNEIYKLLDKVSNSESEILFVTRPTLDLVVSSKFKIVFKESINRGGSEYSIIKLMRK